jgi:hypothetical protein
MSLQHRVSKLISRMEMIRQLLEDQRRYTSLHRSIDPYYYIEKITELTLLREASARGSIGEHVMATVYTEAYCRWRKDVRWLNQYTLKPGLF